MGLPGMILAPVVLHYLKVESTKIKVEEVLAATTAGEATKPTLN